MASTWCSKPPAGSFEKCVTKPTAELFALAHSTSTVADCFLRGPHPIEPVASVETSASVQLLEAVQQ